MNLWKKKTNFVLERFLEKTTFKSSSFLAQNSSSFQEQTFCFQVFFAHHYNFKCSFKDQYPSFPHPFAWFTFEIIKTNFVEVLHLFSCFSFLPVRLLKWNKTKLNKASSKGKRALASNMTDYRRAWTHFWDDLLN